MLNGESERVVGTIAIEPSGEARRNHSPRRDCDSTLGEFLIYLASDGFGSPDSMESTDMRRLPFDADRFSRPARMSARLENLMAELELAVAQVRHRIAVSARSAA